MNKIRNLIKKLIIESEIKNDSKCIFLVLKGGIDNFDSRKKELTQEFIKFVAKELGISEGCSIYFSANRNENLITTASYNPNNHNIWIYVKNRNMLGDILRSLAHEMMHFKQNLKKELHADSGADGSDHENEANSFSGKMIRKFGKLYPEIYE